MEEVYGKYRQDKEAAVFYALALCAAADPADKAYLNQRKAGKILESLFPDQPNHPGIAHYIIHCYDYPELAAMALTTARRYAEIAPASAHAQHMPSHIFTRLGLWEEAINSNLASVSSAQCYGQRVDSTGHWDEELHGMDYLVYAYLQTGNNEKANELGDYLHTFRAVFPVNFKVAYASAAIPVRIALENHAWKTAENLPLPSVGIPWDKFPWEESILYFARSLGAARLGDLISSEKDLSMLKTLHQNLVDLKDDYKANQVQIQILAASAWNHLKRGEQNEAISMMTQAANLEYNTAKHPVTPGEVLPAGELLGDLYMEVKMYGKALDAYAFDLTQHPNRLNGLYGAASAARKLGDKTKAVAYFEALILSTAHSATSRMERKEALAFVQHPAVF